MTKVLFLYVGPEYPNYSADDMNKLSNVNEFVILPSPSYSRYGIDENSYNTIIIPSITALIDTIEGSNKRGSKVWI